MLRIYDGFVPIVPQVLSGSDISLNRFHPLPRPFVFPLVLSCSLSPFFRTFDLSRIKMWGSSFGRLFCFLGPIVPISPDSPLYIVAFLQPSHQTFVASCRFALIGLATFPHLIVYLDLAGKDRIIENSVLLGKGLPIIAAPSECRTVQEPTANSIKNTTAFSRMRTQEIPHLSLTEIRWDRYQLYPVIPRFIAIFVVEFDIHFPCVDDQVDIAGRLPRLVHDIEAAIRRGNHIACCFHKNESSMRLHSSKSVGHVFRFAIT